MQYEPWILEEIIYACTALQNDFGRTIQEKHGEVRIPEISGIQSQ